MKEIFFFLQHCQSLEVLHLAGPTGYEASKFRTPLKIVTWIVQNYNRFKGGLKRYEKRASVSFR